METHAVAKQKRLPRFRRAPEPPAFRLTDGDIEIVRQLARHRFLRSTHVAALTGRSLDAVNGRLSGLYHHGYVDRPPAQLDYHPSGGSDFFVYALADRGARLLIQQDGIEFANVEWSRKNRRAGRPFMEHQLEIVDFRVGLIEAVRAWPDVRLILPEEIVGELPAHGRAMRNPFAMKVTVTDKGILREVGLVPDFAFSLELGRRKRRNFFVEIDRGTMPVTRRDFEQTSFEKKMRCYLAARTARVPSRQLGWEDFRVLTMTSDERRRASIIERAKALQNSGANAAGLFLLPETANPHRHSADVFKLVLDG